MKRLQERGTAVYLVSGGFRRVIQGAAEQLNIPDENVFANRLQIFSISGQANVYFKRAALAK